MGKTTSSSSSSSRRLLHPVPTHVAGADQLHLADLDEEEVWSVQPDRRRRWTAGGLSLAFDHHQRHHHHQQAADVQDVQASSAPVKVPEWRRKEEEEEEQEEEEEEREWVAPHEYVRVRQRRKQGGTTSSVLEGVGRTLKGRDLSRVRDAVWTNTGFFG